MSVSMSARLTITGDVADPAHRLLSTLWLGLQEMPVSDDVHDHGATKAAQQAPRLLVLSFFFLS